MSTSNSSNLQLIQQWLELQECILAAMQSEENWHENPEIRQLLGPFCSVHIKVLIRCSEVLDVPIISRCGEGGFCVAFLATPECHQKCINSLFPMLCPTDGD